MARSAIAGTLIARLADARHWETVAKAGRAPSPKLLSPAPLSPAVPEAGACASILASIICTAARLPRRSA